MDRAPQYNIIQITHVHKTYNVHWECLSKQWMEDSDGVCVGEGGGGENCTVDTRVERKKIDVECPVSVAAVAIR